MAGMTLEQVHRSLNRWRNNHADYPAEVRLHPFTFNSIWHQAAPHDPLLRLSMLPPRRLSVLFGVPIVIDEDANIDWCEWKS